MLKRLIYGVFWLLLSVGVSGALTACTADGAGGASAHAHYAMAALEDMPAEVQAAPVRTSEAYQFAVANREIAEQIPCYCGCSALGHTSSYGCYVAGKNDDGTLKYDLHAVNCGICVDITQDTMRLLENGKSPSEIKAYVDKTYAKFGPSTGP